MSVKSVRDEFNEFVKTGKTGSDSVNKSSIPDAWRPRSEIGTEGGFVVGTPRPDGSTPGAEELLREAGLDPAEWAVVSHRRGRWQRWDEEWLESFRINVVPVVDSGTDYDAQKLIEEISKWKPRKTN